MNVDAYILQHIREHAAREYPRESCGVVVVARGRRRYLTCRNIAERNEHFVIAPEDYVAAEDAGEVVMIVHSHPGVPAIPSQADMVGIEKTGLPWLIVNWPTGAYTVTAPSGYVPPLIGREFAHGVLDCLTLIQDWYRTELGITLKDYPREDEWWLKGKDYYRERFADCGFVTAPSGGLKPHDVIFMQVAAPVPNHGAVYLGDDQIIHHVMHRLSSRDVYGGWWRKITTGVVRHRSLL